MEKRRETESTWRVQKSRKRRKKTNGKRRKKKSRKMRKSTRQCNTAMREQVP